MVYVWTQLEPHLADVEKPARYIGLELGAQRPDHGPGTVSWLLTYPDSYEIGLPNQGLQILYEILNERDDAAAERAYAPWGDLEGVMRRERIPLFSVDTHRAAGDFDVLAFNLSAELTYTNLLNCVDLAGVPVRAAAEVVVRETLRHVFGKVQEQGPTMGGVNLLHAHADPVVKYHAKYLVADEGPALVASLNFTRKCFAKTMDAIVVTHDPPGMIGRLGTLLGEEAVNIAHMAVSRNRRCAKALMALGSLTFFQGEFVRTRALLDDSATLGRTTGDLVSLMQVDGEEYLFYRTFPIDVGRS